MPFDHTRGTDLKPTSLSGTHTLTTLAVYFHFGWRCTPLKVRRTRTDAHYDGIMRGITLFTYTHHPVVFAHLGMQLGTVLGGVQPKFTLEECHWFPRLLG
jgi:hypothetical protein